MKNEKGKAKGPAWKKSVGIMNIILLIVGIFLFVFTVYMIRLFEEYGSIPDTLCTCVYGALAGECGIMGWIKTSKERHRDRRWELQDRREGKSEEEAPSAEDVQD